VKIATATRPRTAEPNHISQVLAASNTAAKLHAFARTTGCREEELSSDQGKSLDLLCVIEAMRRRGYQVSDPVRPLQQPWHGYTFWMVKLAVNGVRATLAVPIQDTAP
jgi:hypothetical protein